VTSSTSSLAPRLRRSATDTAVTTCHRN